MNLGRAGRPVKHTFVMLDAMRGIAAIAVMQGHWSAFFGKVYLSHFRIAVDFFYMLSGFVLTHAYQQKLDAGWPMRTFMKLRVIRLYPLYLLGFVLGLCFYLERARFQHALFWGTPLCMAIACSLLLLPTPPISELGASFRFDVPTWSIFYELLTNVFHALFLRRRSWKFLLTVAFIAGSVHAWITLHLDEINVGPDNWQIVWAIPRCIFGYTVGMLLYRVWQQKAVSLKIHPSIAIFLLLGSFVGSGSFHQDTLASLLIVIFCYPPLILLSANASLTGRALPIARVLGVTSYAVYVLHVPIAEWFQTIWLRVRHTPNIIDAPYIGLVWIALTFALAYLADVYFDGPCRRALQRRFSAR